MSESLPRDLASLVPSVARDTLAVSGSEQSFPWVRRMMAQTGEAEEKGNVMSEDTAKTPDDVEGHVKWLGAPAEEDDVEGHEMAAEPSGQKGAVADDGE